MVPLILLALALVVPARETLQLAPASDPVIAAAGDIACDPGSPDFRGGRGTSWDCRQMAVSDLLAAAELEAVLTLGDNQYEDGARAKFRRSFDPSWGRVKSLIRPSPGNHDYGTSGAAGYFRYFGTAAGSPGVGYYSFDVGTWHLIALNSNCWAVSCARGSAQEVWLRDDLAANTSQCTLAYWHHPLFSSGLHGDNSMVRPLWRDLYEFGADVVLNGHDHDYERFAPQTPRGALDRARGIREFVVGTGGEQHYPVLRRERHSKVRDSTAFGVLELTLHPTGYDWSFLPAAGGAFSDSGSGGCH